MYKIEPEQTQLEKENIFLFSLKKVINNFITKIVND